MKVKEEIHKKINPKELTNEELEFIIQTGKVPPSVLNKENLPF